MMLKLRVKCGFYDREADRYRPSGEVFEAPEARAKVILAAGVAEVIELLEAPAEETAAEPPDPPKSKRKKG